METVHPLLKPLLDVSELSYKLSGGFIRILLPLPGGDRKQWVLIDNDPDEMGAYSDFDVLSAVCSADKVDGRIALKLLELAGTKKYGGFVKREGKIFWKADLPSSANAEVLLTLMAAVIVDADMFEKSLTGGGDEF